MKTQEQINKETYLHPPTLAQIDAFVKKCRVSYYRFEAFFGMPRGTIKVVRAGKMNLPVKYWHIIYEEVIPTYGSAVKNPEKIKFKRKLVRKSVTGDKPVQQDIDTPIVVEEQKEVFHPLLNKLK